MAQNVFDWDGDDWEDQCIRLLRMRYKSAGEFERVPSSDSGDLGIEGFSHDGCAYQCYAPKGALEIGDRYAKQRDKLTTDIAKLETNMAELINILGDVVIRTYVFMTPIHDSRRLNKHAKTKAKEIREKNLSHCAADFNIVIHTEEDYIVEQTELINLGLDRLSLSSVPVSDVAVQAYVATNPELIAVIDDKLSRLSEIADSDRVKLRVKLLKHKLTADNKLDEIRGSHPIGWERIQELRAIKESSLEIECLLNQQTPPVLLSETAKKYQEMLENTLAFLYEEDALDLAWGTTTDWLAECPLNFRITGGS